MYKILIFLAASFFISAPAMADTDFLQSNIYQDDNLIFAAYNTDTNTRIYYAELYSGSVPHFNFFPNVELDGVNLLDRLAAKEVQSATLDSLAGMSLSTGQMLFASGSGFSQFSTSSYGRGLLNTSNQAALQTAVGVPTAVSQLTNDSGFITSAPVASVNAHTGTVVLNADDIADGTTNKAYSATDKTKLAGIASGATKVLAYNGSSLVTGPILYVKSATVASGVVVFQLTTDGTSTGTAIFPNGPLTASLNYFVSDATASYQASAAWTNSNKTLTITANKFTTANILSGILGQAAANGAVVNVSVWGN